MSESLAHQNPQSPFRRAPSTIPRNQSGKVEGIPDTEKLLKIAKDNIKNLKLKGLQVCQ